MGAARHHRHFGAALRQETRQVAADRAGTEDADAHRRHLLPPPLRGRVGEGGPIRRSRAGRPPLPGRSAPRPNPPQGGRESLASPPPIPSRAWSRQQLQRGPGQRLHAVADAALVGLVGGVVQLVLAPRLRRADPQLEARHQVRPSGRSPRRRGWPGLARSRRRRTACAPRRRWGPARGRRCAAWGRRGGSPPRSATRMPSSMPADRRLMAASAASRASGCSVRTVPLMAQPSGMML